jgi:hypothetical protein
MAKHLLIVVFGLIPFIALGQQNTFDDTVATYFKEIKTTTEKNKTLWEYDLYAPLLVVRPDTREVYANAPDTAGVLKSRGSIFTGILPMAVNIANTSMRWSGEEWAMVMLPLPDDEYDRMNLFAHELFHTAQPHLGFTLHNPENNHLDRKEARIYLRLELEALKAALVAGSTEEMKTHVTNALTFRGYRYVLYPRADTTENLLELNEGIAEYTGAMMSGRDKQQMETHFLESLKGFLKNPTFVRSFAYQTIPLYGYLLSKTNYEWNRHITSMSNLTEYFLREFSIHLRRDLNDAIAQVADQYGRRAIVEEENAREVTIKKRIAEYRGKFIEQPHLEIALQNMNISFDPRNIMPLEDKGTVYPNIRVTDNWGILTVTNGALMSPNWNKLAVSIPTRIDAEVVTGDGWRLELKHGFVVHKESAGNNFILTKQ